MYLISIKNQNRKETAAEVQALLTRYGENITTRLGIRDPENDKKGIIIVTYNQEDVENFIEDLNKIHEVEVNYMDV